MRSGSPLSASTSISISPPISKNSKGSDSTPSPFGAKAWIRIFRTLASQGTEISRGVLLSLESAYLRLAQWLHEREEAFPELWDRHPNALLRLLEQSACEPVHERTR